VPELAEVEYFRKRWDPGLGARIVAVQLHGEKRIFRGTEVRVMERRLVRQKLLRSQARGKQMLFQFSGGNWLAIHLGMSGKLRSEDARFITGKHDHLVLQQKGRALVFSDARQFGRVRFHHGEEAPDWWQASAPEIHSREFTKPALRKFVRRHSRAPIKAVLLLQNGFPGVGNWMADEILWRARIAPRINAGKLSDDKLDALWRSTRFVAHASLKTIGHDFSDPPKSWLLHERWKRGGKCPRHGTTLRRATIGGRTTAWCASCQR
jgi:formamidopyrimidine-DNA glycosylase